MKNFAVQIPSVHFLSDLPQERKGSYSFCISASAEWLDHAYRQRYVGLVKGNTWLRSLESDSTLHSLPEKDETAAGLTF